VRPFWLALGGVLVLLSSTATAQDSAVVEGPRAERLRELIEERFAERLRVELALSDDQAAKLRGVLATWASRRRALEREERRLREELNAAMRRGVAANEETVNRLVDRIIDGRLAYVQTFKDELKDLVPVLSPVQRAQYVLMRDRLLQRVQEIRNQRQPGLGLGPGRRRP